MSAPFAFSRDEVAAAGEAVAAALRAAEILAAGDARQEATIKGQVVGAIIPELIIAGCPPSEAEAWFRAILQAARRVAELRDAPTLGSA